MNDIDYFNDCLMPLIRKKYDFSYNDDSIMIELGNRIIRFDPFEERLMVLTKEGNAYLVSDWIQFTIDDFEEEFL